MSSINQESIRSEIITIPSYGAKASVSIELSEGYEKLTGCYFGKTTDTLYPIPLMTEFNHDGSSDTFGSDFPIEHLISSDMLSPDDRFKKLDLVANKKKLKITVQDFGGSPSYPYNLNFYYRLQKK